MKCIKDKCKYYREHGFRITFFTCSLNLNGTAFKKDSNVNCMTENYIKSLEKEMKIVQKQMEYIENNQ